MAEDRERINLTILHSNDIHGDFVPEEKNGVLSGGIARLAGYINQTRAKEKNVIYAVAGDMFKGSIIDSEYMGISTIELMNMLAPDVVTLGNHEIDYGLAHLLFIEKCATFPIINANLFITTNHTRLFNPYMIMEKDGIKILFIGIVTEEVLASTKAEAVIGSFVDVREAAEEVGIICDTYKTMDINYTVILSHIGFDKDQELAALLPPEYGVDLIIGGHTHTLLEKAVEVNGIQIVQAGNGTDQIGRIDLIFERGRRHVLGFKYRLVPINENSCEEDPYVKEVFENYKSDTDRKYQQVLTTFRRKLTHPARNQETELGNLFADLMQEDSSFDLMILGSGSLRLPELGPVVHLEDLKVFFPYDDALHLLEVTGEQLKRMMAFILRDDAWTGHTEFYQVSKQLHLVWSRSRHEFLEFTFNGKPLPDDARIKIALQDYHFNNFTDFFGVPYEEVIKNRRPRVVAVSCCGIYEEMLMNKRNLDAHVEGRLTIVD
ncbi:MAG: 5'-nucleotidase C-terminal domain-containing protein [Lachnospiraceae bacterium]|nr:5'-nucleotidase C-terminal domain-containing protein [Lachnospiraceae bacterium]